MNIRGKLTFILGILAGIFVVAGFAFPVLAAGSHICNTYGGECSYDEVGAFMVGISSKCGNEGTCTTADILQVFINIGNFVLKIVGALVFMMYAIGGFYYLLSGGPGQAKHVQKAKDTLKMATLGLMIVFFANAGMKLVENTLIGEEIFYATDGEVYLTCAPGTAESKSPSSGDVCGDNKKCDDYGGCKTECEITYAAEYAEYYVSGLTDADISAGAVTGSTTNGISSPHTCTSKTATGVISSSCVADMCPGDSTIQCCQIYL